MTGKWKKAEIIQKLCQYARRASTKIKITLYKSRAHTGELNNDESSLKKIEEFRIHIKIFIDKEVAINVEGETMNNEVSNSDIMKKLVVLFIKIK